MFVFIHVFALLEEHCPVTVIGVIPKYSLLHVATQHDASTALSPRLNPAEELHSLIRVSVYGNCDVRQDSLMRLQMTDRLIEGAGAERHLWSPRWRERECIKDV